MPHNEGLGACVDDVAALEKLFGEYQPRLLAMLERRIDPALAVRVGPEDILAEVYFVARRKWAYFRKTQMRPYSWLYRLALDCLCRAWQTHNYQCRAVRRGVPLPENSSIQLGLGLMQRGDGPPTEAAKQELRDCMRQALRLLKEQDRDILWMRHNDQLSFAEMAEVLGVSENAATVRYVRALKRLKTLWLKRYPAEG